MISRLIGFYYRIFLTHTIGAEGIGIYQLIFPVYALCFSLTSAGIQTTISRLVAANDCPGGEKTQWRIYRSGLFMSLTIAILVSLILYFKAGWIALHFLQEPRCEKLLCILAYAIPLGAIHSAACGYYYGIKNASIPAITQLAEQIARVAGVYMMATICISRHEQVSISYAVWGLVIGESVSMLISLTAIKYRHCKLRLHNSKIYHSSGHTNAHNPSNPVKFSRIVSRTVILSQLIQQSVPLTANRLCINLLQSWEAVLIPSMLKCYGLSTQSALSTYGVLTGMSLPLILFPSAITNSVSVMLLPTIAEAQAQNHTSAISHAVEISIKYCLLLGTYCTGIFLYLGMDMGNILFHNKSAGQFIITLAWLCPFLYLTTTLGSIVHGLGKTFLYFIYNCLSLVIRIIFVIVMIPRLGIIGYLWGVLVSHLFLTILLLRCLHTQCTIHWHAIEWIVKPALCILCGIIFCRLLRPVLQVTPWPQAVTLGVNALIITFGYSAGAIYTGIARFPKSGK